MVLVVIALCLFEIVNSIDNAVVDADILKGVTKHSRRWFMFWDLVFAVLIVRGVLPWLIIFLTVPSLGPTGAFVASFNGDMAEISSIEDALPLLLIGAGTFFVLLFIDWIFRKPKNFAHFHEKILHGKKELFYAFTIAFIGVASFAALALDSRLILPIFIGATVFFLLHGIKTHFTKHKHAMVAGEKKSLPDLNKLLYLEIIDSVFSVDSVLGAFAFTFSVPLIIIGAGLGALVVRLIIVNNSEKLKKYYYLRNGAMYSVLFLGFVMILESFGVDFPFWLSPLITILIIFYFIHRSHKEAMFLKKIGFSATGK